MGRDPALSRRGFVKAALGAGGGLAIAIALPASGPGARAAGPARLAAFFEIPPDGPITVFCPYAEMGQGVYTAIPQILAEELDAPVSAMRVEQAPLGPEYRLLFGGQLRFTGGSFSVRGSYDALRRAGAAARAMLLDAAAAEGGVQAGSLSTADGAVRHAASGRQAPFGAFAAAAAALPVPEDAALKSPDTFERIGQPLARTDVAAKTTGAAQFGLDVRLEGMAFAAVRQSPTHGGAVASLDKRAILDRPGVIDAVAIPNGVAVVADTTWAAMRGLEALPVTFDKGDNAGLSSRALADRLAARLDEPGVPAERDGDATAGLAGAPRRVEAVYTAPFLAHATMEPMNCTARFNDDGTLEVWAPNQGPDFVAMTAAQVAGIDPARVIVHTPYLGGGFGRRFIMDYVVQAVSVARAVGRPVQVVWSREEDTRHDFYRPMAAVKLRAGLGETGTVQALHVTAVGDGPVRRHFAGSMPAPDLDPSVVEGLIHQPYAMGARRVDYVYEPIPVPIGFWRSVGHSMNAFFMEGFMDEVARAAGADPVGYRLSLLADRPRERAVLERVAAMADWRDGPFEVNGRRRAMGVALHESFGSKVAQIAEVSVSGGRAVVHRVHCAIDPGFVVNPAIVEAQIASGVAYGLSQTLHERVTLEDGATVEGNFDTYPVLAPHEMPAVEVAILQSGEALGGIGEIGTPPIAPAVVNALWPLTRRRIRALPLSQYDLEEA